LKPTILDAGRKQTNINRCIHTKRVGAIYRDCNAIRFPISVGRVPVSPVLESSLANKARAVKESIVKVDQEEKESKRFTS